jgi:hypothetical protein
VHKPASGYSPVTGGKFDFSQNTLPREQYDESVFIEGVRADDGYEKDGRLGFLVIPGE